MKKYTYLIYYQFEIGTNGGLYRNFITIDHPINDDSILNSVHKYLPDGDKFTGFMLKSISLMDIQE